MNHVCCQKLCNWYLPCITFLDKKNSPDDFKFGGTEKIDMLPLSKIGHSLKIISKEIILDFWNQSLCTIWPQSGNGVHKLSLKESSPLNWHPGNLTCYSRSSLTTWRYLIFAQKQGRGFTNGTWHGCDVQEMNYWFPPFAFSSFRGWANGCTLGKDLSQTYVTSYSWWLLFPKFTF